jgi:hypothetical protein
MRANGFSRSIHRSGLFFIPLLAVIDRATHFANAQQAELQNGLAETSTRRSLAATRSW